MAKVIKAKSAPVYQAETSQVRSPESTPQKKIIGRDIYRAQMEAKQMLKNAEKARLQKLEDGRRLAARKKEEAMASSASDALNKAAIEALSIFESRAKLFYKAREDIGFIASELIKKIVGEGAEIDSKLMARTSEEAIKKLRAKKKVVLEFPETRLSSFESEFGSLMSKMDQMPEFEFSASKTISEGYLRLVLDVGSITGEEKKIISELSKFIEKSEFLSR